MAQTEAGEVKKRPFVVSVEGNIGSGKSTFLKHFKSIPGVATYEEPVADWCDVGGHNMLSLLYEDPDRWSFAFQSVVQLSRLNVILQPTTARVKLIERSLQNNRYCFLEIGRKMGSLSPPEYAVLTEYYDWLDKRADIGLDLIVYLKTTPEVAYERMRRRKRPEEKLVPLSYIQLVHQCYESWLNHNPPAPVLIVNANQTQEELTDVFDLNRSTILGLNGA